MEIKIKNLKTILYKIAKKYVSEEESEYFANEILEAHIRKYPRWNVLHTLIEDVKRQEKYKGNSIQIVQDSPAAMKVDFQHLPLTFKIKWIHDVIEKKAKASGIAFFAFDNSSSMHALHTWAQGLTKRGLFVLVSFNGGPKAVVPTNGTEGFLGTNPISFGFPTVEGNTIVDMATSEIPFFELADAKKAKIKIRENCAVDNDGKMTTDPTKALHANLISNILPIGGSYKGFAINYLFEIMTGSMINSKLSDQQDLAYIEEEHGGFIMAINISLFAKLDAFKNDVSRFNFQMRSQKPIEGKEIKVPGDDNLKKYIDAQKKEEVIIDKETWEELNKLAQ